MLLKRVRGDSPAPASGQAEPTMAKLLAAVSMPVSWTARPTEPKKSMLTLVVPVTGDLFFIMVLLSHPRVGPASEQSL